MSLFRPLKRYRRRLVRQRNWSVRDNLLVELATGVRGQLYLDRGGGPADSTLLAGTARSGTSWISEVINHDNDHRIIHEPLRRDRLAITRHFRPRHYLRPDDDDPTYLEPMSAILSGRVRGLWTDKYNRRLLPRRRLIREVRGNLLLPWIRRHFPETPTILLLRHPCAVASSQMKWGTAWPIDLGRFLSEEHLAEDHLESCREELAAVTDQFERHVFAWCIENVVPLRGLSPGEVHVAFYESFCTEPAAELGRLFAFLGGGPEEEAGALDRLSLPSNSTRRDSAIVSGESLVEGWRRHVSRDQIERCVRILGLFGLDRVYGEGFMPLLEDPSDALAVG